MARTPKAPEQSPEDRAAAILAQLQVSAALGGVTYPARHLARTAAREAGCRTFGYGKRRFVAVAPDGRLFYLGGAEDSARWVPMDEIKAAQAEVESDEDTTVDA